MMSESNNQYQILREIVEALLETESPLDKKTINLIKNRICGKYSLARIPTNADILKVTLPEEEEVLKPFLMKRPVRTISGVAVIAAMTRPHECPHGKCAYCPGGPDQGVPQSYTGYEPATMRGIQNAFDPYQQVSKRLEQLRTIGHNVSKIELIIMGGDWCSKSYDYRTEFVKGCFDALNGVLSVSLKKAQNHNETAEVRNTGLTFETRPDQITTETINDMLSMGATRVELGVQTLLDEVLEYVERGHTVATTAAASKLLRDSGLKVCFHMMPGLPKTTYQEDLEVFKKLFSDSRFRPDMLKIYPTIVVKNTKLYEWWKEGMYTPLNTDDVVSLVSSAMKDMPEYVRIQRMQRDIPIHQIEAGLDKGNLRELVHQSMADKGYRNPTIRFREIGHYMLRNDIDLKSISTDIVRRDYQVSDGTEIFLSIEDSTLDIILGFLRLRYPSDEVHRTEIRRTASVLIRELRVYGPLVDVGTRKAGAWQHLGLGEHLVVEAEKIGREEFDARQIVVNSGIGVKNYYRSLNYTDTGPYLAKPL